MDIKIGFLTWADVKDDPNHFKERSLEKSKNSTSASLGFRIAG